MDEAETASTQPSTDVIAYTVLYKTHTFLTVKPLEETLLKLSANALKLTYTATYQFKHFSGNMTTGHCFRGKEGWGKGGRKMGSLEGMGSSSKHQPGNPECNLRYLNANCISLAITISNVKKTETNLCFICFHLSVHFRTQTYCTASVHSVTALYLNISTNEL